MSPAKKRSYDMSSRSAGAAQTRERMLEAAMALFVTHHYDDITFPRIAERAGVSPQTVALHFGNKAGLVKAVADWRRPREDAARAVSSGDPLEAARVICARYDELGPATLRILAIEERVPEVAPILEHGRASHRAWVESTFGKQLGTGAARERRIVQLVVAYDVYTWELLRRALGPEERILAMAELARGVLSRKGAAR